MVVGRETKGWTIIGENEQFTSLDAYVDIALHKHRNYLAANLPKPPDKGQSFFNLMRAVSGHCGSDGLVWANLYKRVSIAAVSQPYGRAYAI